MSTYPQKRCEINYTNATPGAWLTDCSLAVTSLNSLISGEIKEETLSELSNWIST